MLADQALEVLREDSPASLAEVHTLQLIIRHFRGDLLGAEKHFTTGRAFFDDPGFKQNPAGGPTITFGHARWNAWLLGRADVARERIALMMAAGNVNNPFCVAYAGCFASYLRVYLREYEEAEALAARALELSEEHHLPNQTLFCRLVLGHARAQLGRTTEGIALIREGIASSIKAGERFGSQFAVFLAAAQGYEGTIIDALDTLEQALQANPDEVFQPEILRLRGELRLKLTQLELAETDFREAISLSQEMGAKAWELRATMSLARLLRDTGRSDEARTLVAEIYNWFTEGIDTPDLKDAKTLLDELSG